MPCSSRRARGGFGFAAGYEASEAQRPVGNQGGMDLWWTKPAERRLLLKSVGRRPAPAGTAPAVMSRSSIPVKPRAKIRASAHACASFQGNYWKELVRGPGGDVRSQKSRIAGKCYDPGTCGQMGIPREAELTGAQAGHELARYPSPVATVWPSLSAG